MSTTTNTDSHRAPPPASAPRTATTDRRWCRERHEAAIAAACARIAPVWRLESFVAVNPYLGLADHRFDDAAVRLAEVAGVRATLPAAYYLDLLDQGRITAADLDAAIAALRDAPATDAGDLLRGLRAETRRRRGRA